MSGSENKKYSIKFISEYIDASIIGDADLQIDDIATLDNAVQGCVTFLANSKYNKLLESTKASAVIVKEGTKTHNETTLLVCSDPYLAFAKLSKLFSDEIDFSNGSFQNSIFLHDSVNLGKDVKVGPNVYIGKNCNIGDKTVTVSYTHLTLPTSG